MSNTSKVLFRRDEIAELLGVSVATVIDLTKSKQLRTVRIGRAVRVHADDFNEFARRGTQNKPVSGKPLDPLWAVKEIPEHRHL